jgi:O-antigen ligase
MPTKTLRARFPLLAGVAVLLFLVIDAPRAVSAGPITLSGLITIATAGIVVLLLPAALLARRYAREGRVAVGREPSLAGNSTHLWVPLSLAFFITWGLIRLVMGFSVEGMQNMAVYIAFVGTIPIVASVATASSAERVLTGLRIAAVVTSVIFIGSTLVGVQIYGLRSYAMVGLVFLAVLVPFQARNRLARLAPLVVVLAIVLSLSRTATAIALLLLIFIVVRGKTGARLARAVALLVVIALAALIVFLSYPPLQERFFGGDNAVEYGGVTFNTSGRTVLWDMTLSNLGEHWLYGNGPGSAVELISSRFSNISHPHNEYLRLLHDFGVIGLILFAFGFGVLFVWVAKRASRLNQPVHWSAVIAMISIAAMAITDNPLVCQFAMLPTAVLIGLSVATPLPTHLRAAQPVGQVQVLDRV